MAYVKNNWVDQSVERPKTYEMTNNSDGSVTLIDSFGLVAELGTPVNADNMNHIEEGIAGCDLRKHNLTETFQKGEWVTGVVEDVKGIYESLKDNNYGNLLTDETSWKKVELGGGGSGFNLFDLITSDHILDEKESKGKALLGTYVYKNAVAGSRDGYPDFYNKCLEEKNTGTATQVTLGDSTITMYINTNGHQFYNIADKTAVDAWYDTYGIAWYYGVDEENERIFLPRNIHYSESLMMDDYLKILYPLREACSNNTQYTADCDGWLIGYDSHSADSNANNRYVYINGVNMRFTKSSPDYYINTYLYFVNKGDTYQFQNIEAAYFVPCKGGQYTRNLPDVLKNIPIRRIYMIVGNIEQQSAITDVVDVTTSENDTIPLFTGMYFDFKPNHPSWLKAGEQVNSGDIYESAYNILVNCLTGTNPYNLKVIEESAMISGTDYSEYWKINQDGMYFVTPTKISYLPINADTAPVMGNGMSLGLNDGVKELVLSNHSISNNSTYNFLRTGVPKSYGLGQSINNGTESSEKTIGVTTDPTKSGIVADLSGAKSTIAQLYFKVANAVQNLELMDAGAITEVLSNKVDTINTKWAINACTPDYSARINIPVPTSEATAYTAPFACEIRGIATKAYYAGFYAYIKDNDTQDYLKFMVGNGNVQNFTQSNHFSFTLSPGTKIYFTSDYVHASYLFIIPLKGAK